MGLGRGVQGLPWLLALVPFCLWLLCIVILQDNGDHALAAELLHGMMRHALDVVVLRLFISLASLLRLEQQSSR